MPITLELAGADIGDSPLARFSFTRAAVQWMDEVGPVVREALKEQAPVAPDNMITGARGGRLRDSIRYERETALGAVTGIFTANVPYAEYVIKGTGPHTIAASAARALQFELDGAVTYRRQVRHPGTKANNFPERAVTPLTVMLRDSFSEAVQASMEGA